MGAVTDAELVEDVKQVAFTVASPMWSWPAMWSFRRFDGNAGQWRIVAGTYKIALGKNAAEFVVDADVSLSARLATAFGGAPAQRAGEGGKRAAGAAKGRHIPVNNGHSRSPAVTRKPTSCWGDAD